jgi:hypothetical protein
MSKSSASETETGLLLINELHRLELRSEQVRIHLSSLQTRSAEARSYAAELATMQQEINRIKGRCREIEPALVFSRINPKCLN